MVVDPLGRAMLDVQRGKPCGNCLHRDGDSVADARIYGFYFRPPETFTDAEGRVVVDSYDPRDLDPETFFGYRSDPRPGVAQRAFHVEYHREGPDDEVTRDIGRTLQFVLFGPDRLAEAAVGTPWRVTEVRLQEAYYRAVLEK